MKDKNILEREYDAGLLRFTFNNADKRLSKDINVIGVEKISFESRKNVPSPTYQKEGRPFEAPTSILKR